MPDPDGYPTLPTDRLDEGGWERLDRRRGDRLSVPGATVREHTLVYEDATLRRAVRAATGGRHDAPWRLFLATRLTFAPPLAPLAASTAYPAVVVEAQRAFAVTLSARGCTDVRRGRRERMPAPTGGRAALREFTATRPLDGRTLDVAGWLAVWANGGEFRLAGGAYPDESLSAALGVDASLDGDPHRYRSELLELIREVR